MFGMDSLIKFKHGRDWRGGAAVAVVGELVEPQAMERERNPGKPLTDGLLAIFLLGFARPFDWAQGPEFSQTLLVCNVKNGKMFFFFKYLFQKKSAAEIL